jgi:hypothetical protein
MAWLIVSTLQASLAIFSIILSLLRRQKERINITNEESIEP